jgi:hypothetical protein
MEATVVYRFRIALRGVDPKIWRRVELTAASSLADLQRVIQISLEWSDEYQHRFCIRKHYLGASRAGGLLFSGDPEDMPLSRFAFGLYERFSYEYNFFDAWLLDIRFEGEDPFDPRHRYPRCVAGREFHGSPRTGITWRTKGPPCGSATAGDRGPTEGYRS